MTPAQSSRERRDLVTGEVMDEARLIRFVAGPDGVVTPDIGRRLPGRGLWVAADRASIDAAAKKNLFARAAKARLVAPADLADQVEALLLRRLLAALGLARKAGDLVIGFEKTLAQIRAGKAAVLIEAADGAADGRGKLLALASHISPPPLLIGLFTGLELDLALGGENVIHTAFLAGRGADRWTFDARRLSGFRPLFPKSWREEPGDEGTVR
jgi:predicted RNA-binding protein YlxR (DUF448 family)/ribosomal protein L30E